MAGLTGSNAVVWKTNPPSGKHILIPHDRPAALTFTPDGSWLAVAAADGLHLHAIRRDDPKNVRAAPVNKGSRKIMNGPIVDLCFDAKGKTLVTVRGDTGAVEVQAYDARSTTVGNVRYSFPGNIATRCAISPDGRWLATGSAGNGDACIYDLTTGAVALKPPAPCEAKAWLPVFSHDGAWLALSGRTSFLLRTSDWKTMAVAAPPNQGNGRGAAFLRAPDNAVWLAVTAGDDEVHLFRTGESLTKLAVLRAPQGGSIGSLTASVHGTLAAAAPKGEVQLWPVMALRKYLDELHLGFEHP
jgi:WD40 repeat protein